MAVAGSDSSGRRGGHSCSSKSSCRVMTKATAKDTVRVRATVVEVYSPSHSHRRSRNRSCSCSQSAKASAVARQRRRAAAAAAVAAEAVAVAAVKSVVKTTTKATTKPTTKAIGKVVAKITSSNFPSRSHLGSLIRSRSFSQKSKPRRQPSSGSDSRRGGIRHSNKSHVNSYSKS